MNYKVQRYLHWLRRIKYCRGFGVQSPSAYRFIRYVINEHYPYYAYDELRKELLRLDSLTRKRMELYFRVANFRQASLWLDFCERNDVIATYVGRGCHATQVRRITDLRQITADDRIEVLRICPTAGCEALLEAALQKADDRTLFIIEDIGYNDTAKRMWQKLLESDLTSVSYDLYYLGIAFFDRKRYKANYVVNF
ncbi:hypothetical protein [uncultured Prevotella sp.]|uniref:hypothetical protein n=1 Tax=uncultured Prevotella sp. TaxID=159272 RepID=UPI0027E2848B|nr:hypothetical protein [uncultured Prevotella sp.]